jgi:hypothetical protein
LTFSIKREEKWLMANIFGFSVGLSRTHHDDGIHCIVFGIDILGCNACEYAGRYQHFRGTYCLHPQYLALKMEEHVPLKH